MTWTQSSSGPSPRGSLWADHDVLPTSPASLAPPSAVPQPQLCRGALLPSHHCLYFPLPGGSWGPLTTLWHHPPVQSSMGCTSHNPGELSRALAHYLLPGILICLEGHFLSHSLHTLLNLDTQVWSGVALLKQTPTHDQLSLISGVSRSPRRDVSGAVPWDRSSSSASHSAPDVPRCQ